MRGYLAGRFIGEIENDERVAMTDKSNDREEKKIFIDEDWKTQVQAEKEAAKQQEKEEPQERGESAKQDTEPGQEVPLPSPSFGYLVTSLATQAMMSLGLVAHPESEKPEARPQEAQHLIDTLAMLQEKTKGNLTAEESAMIDSFLHELRMAYMTVKQQSGS